MEGHGQMKKRTMRTVGTVAAAGMAAVMVAACSSSSGSGGSSAAAANGAGGASGATVNLSIAEPIMIVAHAPLYVAIQKGYFAKNHVNVSFSTLNTASTIAEALTSGSIQLASGASFNVISADAKGANYQAVVNMGGITLQVCASKSYAQSNGIDSGASVASTLKKFKGATFGLTGFNSPPQYVLNYLLQDMAGVNPQSGVKEVSLGSVSSAQAALQRGEVQAFFQSPPTCQESSSYAEPVVDTASMAQLRTVPYAMLYATKSWLSSHQTVAREVAQAVAEGDAYVKANPAGAAAVLHQSYFSTVPTSVIQQALVASVIPAIPSGGTMTQAGWQSANAIMTKSGAAASTPSAADGVMWTNSYLSGQ
jgi:ABC-type nitrate/sulfonate/bicarbonate transport system substrate-binding protein